MSRRRAALLLVLLAALTPSAADIAAPARPVARVCYLDLQSVGAPACAAPIPLAALR